MKKKFLKKALLAGVLTLLILRVSIIIFRLPSYKIQTNGKLYIVNKVSENVQVFDLFSGKEIADIPIDMLSHEAVTTTNGKKLVLTSYTTPYVKVIDTKTNTLEKNIFLKDSSRVNGIVAYPESNKVALIDYFKNQFLVLNTETDSIEKAIYTEQKKSHLAVLHPKKPMAYVTNINSGSVSIIDLERNAVIAVIPCGIGRKAIDITPDGSEVWVSNTNENSIKIIDTSTHKITDTLSSGYESLKLKFSLDGKFCFVVNSMDGALSIYNRHSRKKIKTIIFHGISSITEKLLYHTPRPVNILMHPNGLYAFITNSNASKIEVIDMKTFEIVSTIGTDKVPDALAFVE